MNKRSRNHYILIFCLCLSAISCKAQTELSASDAKALGFNGPVKKAVLHYFLVKKNSDVTPSNEEPFNYNPNTTLLIRNVSIFDKQGMIIRVEDENCTRPSSAPIRDYQIIKNGLGKKYDDINRPIGHTTRNWSNGCTLVYKSFDNNNRLEAEAVRHYNSNFRLDSSIMRYEDGSFRKICDYYQYKDSIITVSSSRTDAEGRNTLVKSTMSIETKDRYGNVLRQTTSNNDGQQYIMEYEYTYYDTPEEAKETANEKMLLPNGKYPHAGVYEAEHEDGHMRLCLFANGRYAFEIMSNQLKSGNRGRYNIDKNQQIIFAADRPDTTRFYVYGRHNGALPAGKQHIYFLDNGAAMEYMLFAINTRPFDTTYNNAYPLKKANNRWYVKETDRTADRSLWLYELLFSQALYRFGFSGPDNEFRVTQNPDAGKETADILLQGTAVKEGIQLAISLSYSTPKQWESLGVFSKKAVSVLPHFLESILPAEPREIFIAGQSYKRIYPDQVTKVKDGQLRYEIAPEPSSLKGTIEENVIERKGKK